MSLKEIENRLQQAIRNAGRVEKDVTLIAVSKTHPADYIIPALDAGHREFGENRVQEAAAKWPPLRDTYPEIRLHLIGPLQTNKARQAMALADAIHTLDRPKLAHTLARLAQATGACPDLFIQVNTGAESQKAGILPADADAFISECRGLDLPVTGLMCIPPVHETPALHFALLAKIAGRNGLKGLSMGMSADFEQAVAFGATHIRVGSAIFGARPAPPVA